LAKETKSKLEELPLQIINDNVSSIPREQRPPPRPKETKPKRKEGCRGGEVKQDDLLKREVTNLPNAHNAKVNAAMEKEMEKDREKTIRSLVTFRQRRRHLRRFSESQSRTAEQLARVF